MKVTNSGHKSLDLTHTHLLIQTGSVYTDFYSKLQFDLIYNLAVLLSSSYPKPPAKQFPNLHRHSDFPSRAPRFY